MRRVHALLPPQKLLPLFGPDASRMHSRIRIIDETGLKFDIRMRCVHIVGTNEAKN